MIGNLLYLALWCAIAWIAGAATIGEEETA